MAMVMALAWDGHGCLEHGFGIGLGVPFFGHGLVLVMEWLGLVLVGAYICLVFPSLPFQTGSNICFCLTSRCP